MRTAKMTALVGLLAQLLLLGPSSAADYPSRPIKLLVGASAGGTTDTMARTIAEPLSSLFGQPVLVENRPGAGGNIAAEVVARSAPDGYTLLVSFTSHTINATLYPKLPFDPVGDFTPIAMISTVPSLLVGNPKIPAQNLKELIALAKAKPGALTMAIGGIGSSLHLAGDRFKMMADVNIVNVPYKGTAPATYRRIGWAGGSDVHQPGHRHCSGPGRQLTRLRGHECGAAAVISGSSGDWRDRFGFRVGGVVRSVRPGEAS